MDPSRFDTLTRSLTDTRSRRTALTSLLGGTLGLLGLADTTAKKGKGKKGKKKKRGQTPLSPLSPPPSPPPPPGPPTCSDGIKNGSETGVDCGGPTCPRCANGQSCVSRNDCRSAMCNLQVNTCEPCTSSGDCGEDANGDCQCYPPVQGTNVCGKGGMPDLVTSCTLCPAPNVCWQPQPSEIFCVRQCGT